MSPWANRSVLLSLTILLTILAAQVAALGAAGAASSVFGACYLADTPFPEYINCWQEGWNFKDADGETLAYAYPDMPLGGYAFVYYRNSSGQPIKITDLTVEGVKLSQGLGMTHIPTSPDQRFQCSILLSDLPKTEIAKLVAAGSPVWWKPEPMQVPAGGMAEIVVRLRRDPKIPTLHVGIVTDVAGTISATVPVKKPSPRFDTISFTPDLKAAYLYAERPSNGPKPVKILMDGVDVTKYAEIAGDPSSRISSIVLKPAEPLKWMSYHNFRAVYADGSQAVAGIRAWGREMVYGIWWAAADIGTSEASVKAALANLTQHSINGLVGQYYSAESNPWFGSDAGWAYTDSLGIGRMTNYLVKNQTPMFFFLMDEADACDASTEQVPIGDRLGTSGQWLVKWQDVLRRKGPDTPGLLNIDGTFKPENYYMYHQLPDIPCIDPYYQPDLDMAYFQHPYSLQYKTKPTHVLATTTVSESAARPKPLHVILVSTKYPREDKNYPGRFPTPEEKRMEVYYAIGAGAKGLSYWWYTTENGCGSSDPAAKALFKEIGLLGIEVRTAGPIITSSCPAELPVKASRFMWHRTLLSGNDTVAAIFVNDNVLCDRVGTVYMPIENARATVTMPSWLGATDAFEVTGGGIRDVKWSTSGSNVSLELGKMNISRFVIITRDKTLRSQLQKRYDTMFAGNAKALMSGG